MNPGSLALEFGSKALCQTASIVLFQSRQTTWARLTHSLSKSLTCFPLASDTRRYLFVSHSGGGSSQDEEEEFPRCSTCVGKNHKSRVTQVSEVHNV